jgi:hypothetical protein
VRRRGPQDDAPCKLFKEPKFLKAGDEVAASRSRRHGGAGVVPQGRCRQGAQGRRVAAGDGQGRVGRRRRPTIPRLRPPAREVEIKPSTRKRTPRSSMS